MIIYIIILILVLLTNIFNPKKVNRIDLLFFLFLALISGFRYGVGTDFFEYVHYFHSIEQGNTTIAEPGFVFLANIISSSNFNSQLLFLVLSTLTMIFLYKGLKFYTEEDYHYKPVLYILMLIHVFFPSLNVVRQILAAVIVLYASRYIVNRSFLKFVLWIFVASLFHSSSIIFIALYFIVLKNFRRVSLITILVLSLVLANFGVINIVLEYISLNLNFLDFTGYIQRYLNSSYNAREINFGIVFYINLIVLILYILIKDRLIINKKGLIAFNLFYFYIISYILAIDAYVLSRFNYYFGIYMAISISKFGYLFEYNSRRVVEYILLILYSLLFFYIILFQPIHDIVPYDYNFEFRK